MRPDGIYLGPPVMPRHLKYGSVIRERYNGETVMLLEPFCEPTAEATRCLILVAKKERAGYPAGSVTIFGSASMWAWEILDD